MLSKQDIAAVARLQHQKGVQVFEACSDDGVKTRIVIAPRRTPGQASVSSSADVVSPISEETIRSKWFGKFRATHPDRPGAQVNPGDAVEEGQTLALLELNGLYTKVLAPSAGTLLKCLVAEDDLIDFGKPLFAFKSYTT